MYEVSPSLPAPPRTVAAYLAVLRLARVHGYVITRLKMAKLLYLADLEAVKDAEEPVSGVEWRWLQHGPFNNQLQFLENELVDQGAVSREHYYDGYRVRLVRDVAGYDMPADELLILETVVKQYGRAAASSLKDLSYQTPPMVDAQKRGQGVVLDLSLARPRPRLGGLARQMSAVLRRLPEQETQPGVFTDLQQEIDELADSRRRATKALMDGD